jgi:hypothetical protein
MAHGASGTRDGTARRSDYLDLGHFQVLEGGASRDRTGDLLLAKSTKADFSNGRIQVLLVNPGSGESCGSAEGPLAAEEASITLP